jgi:hypothetical protein
MPETKSSDRQVSVGVSLQLRKIEVVIMAGGHPIPQSAVNFTREQAIAHIQAMMQAVDILDCTRPPSLILPSGIPAKAFQT